MNRKITETTPYLVESLLSEQFPYVTGWYEREFLLDTDV